MLGLTRAFHFAGASTVLAALWQVEDVTTAELMARFYTHRAHGASEDEALQRAQVELLTGPIEPLTRDQSSISNVVGWVSGRKGPRTIDARHPFFWAGFTLSGDWR